MTGQEIIDFIQRNKLENVTTDCCLGFDEKLKDGTWLSYHKYDFAEDLVHHYSLDEYNEEMITEEDALELRGKNEPSAETITRERK